MGNPKRWQQRLEVLEQAFSRLREAVEQPTLSELERNGLVQRFEFTLEVSWKVMRDLLLERGLVVKASPRETFREALHAGYLSDIQALLDGIDIRNTLSHDYSGMKFAECEPILRHATYPALIHLLEMFRIEARQENEQ